LLSRLALPDLTDFIPSINLTNLNWWFLSRWFVLSNLSSFSSSGSCLYHRYFNKKRINFFIFDKRGGVAYI